MKKKSFGNDIPSGLSMVLARNPQARDYFSGLSHERQKQLIEGTRGIASKEEMHSYVDSFLQG